MTDRNFLNSEQIFNRAFDQASNTIRIAPSSEWDSMTSSKPDAVTEEYVFTKDGVTVETVTVVYEDATKEFITNINRVRG